MTLLEEGGASAARGQVEDKCAAVAGSAGVRKQAGKFNDCSWLKKTGVNLS